MEEKTEDVVFTCPRCGCHTLQYRTLTPVYNDVIGITRKRDRKVFPMNKHDEYDYSADCGDNNEYNYDGEIEDGVECGECGMRWKSLNAVALSGCLQVPCPGVDLDEMKNKPSFKETRHMEANHILGVNKAGCLVVLTHLVYNFPALHSARVAVMKPLTMDDVDDARKHQAGEVCRQFWQEAVAAGETEQSLEAFSEDLKSNECGPGGKLFVGDDLSMRHETEVLFGELPDAAQNLLLQAMEVGAPEEPDTNGARTRDARGFLPVVAFSCEWTGNLESNWMEEMSVMSANKDALPVVNAYAGTAEVSVEENERLRSAWLALKPASSTGEIS